MFEADALLMHQNGKFYFLSLQHCQQPQPLELPGLVPEEFYVEDLFIVLEALFVELHKPG